MDDRTNRDLTLGELAVNLLAVVLWMLGLGAAIAIAYSAAGLD